VGDDSRRAHAVALCILSLLFLGRVVGQALVVCCAVGWLPPMEAWYSGLLEYRWLLPSQVLILAFQTWVTADLTRGQGWWARPRRTLGRWLLAASAVYATGMVIRYGLTMTWHPERRWLGQGTIPIAFHLVLASWLWVLARWNRRGPLAGAAVPEAAFTAAR